MISGMDEINELMRERLEEHVREADRSGRLHKRWRMLTCDCISDAGGAETVLSV